MHIGFTGSRSGLEINQKETIEKILRSLGSIQSAHHGDCIGADADFHEICDILHLHTTIHPPTNEKQRAFCDSATHRSPLPYLERNREIVRSCDLLIGAPHGLEKTRSGTWSTIRFGRTLQRSIVIVAKGGAVTIENIDLAVIGALALFLGDGSGKL